MSSMHSIQILPARKIFCRHAVNQSIAYTLFYRFQDNKKRRAADSRRGDQKYDGTDRAERTADFFIDPRLHREKYE